jgi:hypothetical protein
MAACCRGLNYVGALVTAVWRLPQLPHSPTKIGFVSQFGAGAAIYLLPRLLCRFDLVVKAISIRRRIASGRPGLSGWLEAH